MHATRLMVSNLGYSICAGERYMMHSPYYTPQAPSRKSHNRQQPLSYLEAHCPSYCRRRRKPSSQGFKEPESKPRGRLI
jgi:hypothetical protein